MNRSVHPGTARFTPTGRAVNTAAWAGLWWPQQLPLASPIASAPCRTNLEEHRLSSWHTPCSVHDKRILPRESVMFSKGSILMFSILVAACGTDSSSDSSERGAIGKADLYGTCTTAEGGTHCGGKSFGNCYCDDECDSFGDCCSDLDSVCNPLQLCDPNDPICPSGTFCAPYACAPSCPNCKDCRPACLPDPDAIQLCDPDAPDCPNGLICNPSACAPSCPNCKDCRPGCTEPVTTTILCEPSAPDCPAGMFCFPGACAPSCPLCKDCNPACIPQM